MCVCVCGNKPSLLVLNDYYLTNSTFICIYLRTDLTDRVPYFTK